MKGIDLARAVMLVAAVSALGGCSGGDDVGPDAELLVDGLVGDAAYDGQDLYWAGEAGVFKRTGSTDEAIWSDGSANVLAAGDNELLWMNVNASSPLWLQAKDGSGAPQELNPGGNLGSPHILNFDGADFAIGYLKKMAADTVALNGSATTYHVSGDITALALDGDEVFYADQQTVYRLTSDGASPLADAPLYDYRRSLIVGETHLFTVEQGTVGAIAALLAIPREGGEPVRLVEAPQGCGTSFGRQLAFDGTHVYFLATLEFRDRRCYGSEALYRVPAAGGEVETVWARFTGPLAPSQLFTMDDSFVYMGGSWGGSFLEGLLRVPKTPPAD